MSSWGYAKESYRYSAFGEVSVFNYWGFALCDSAYDNPYQFLSKRCDEEVGLLLFGRRYYLPEFGRWLTPDPAGFGDGPNLYAYCHNCPLALIDRIGLESEYKWKTDRSLMGLDVKGDAHLFTRNPDWISPFKVTSDNASQAVVHCPNYHIDHHYPYEVGTFSLGREPFPNGGSVTVVNGINMTPGDAWELAEGISDIFGGHDVTVIYSPTKGRAEDIRRVGKEVYLGLTTGVTDKLQTRWDNLVENSRPDAKHLCIGYSGGGAASRNALYSYSAEKREKLVMVNICAAARIPKSLCADSINIEGKRDIVPHVDRFGRGPDTNYNVVRLDPAPGALRLDHNPLGDTYTPTWDRVAENYFNQLSPNTEHIPWEDLFGSVR